MRLKLCDCVLTALVPFEGQLDASADRGCWPGLAGSGGAIRRRVFLTGNKLARLSLVVESTASSAPRRDQSNRMPCSTAQSLCRRKAAVVEGDWGAAAEEMVVPAS